jgi:hypothetical protein
VSALNQSADQRPYVEKILQGSSMVFLPGELDEIRRMLYAALDEGYRRGWIDSEREKGVAG